MTSDRAYVSLDGYGSTSKMIAESALCLVRDVQGEGGIWTPGALMGPALRKRLTERAGLTFSARSGNAQNCRGGWTTSIVTDESTVSRARASNPVQWPLLALCDKSGRSR